MKTFEERYTAWIDGELQGNALVAFEQELARRATVQEAAIDKADAMRLSAFLHDQLAAPAMTNADFFNHQLRERISGERATQSGNSRSHPAGTPIFRWSAWRLVTLGAACLFIGSALYYGMIPKNASSRGAGPEAIAVNVGQVPANDSNPKVTAPDNASSDANRTGDGTQYAMLSKEDQARRDREQDLMEEQQKHQREIAMIEPGSDIQARVPDQTVPTTVTPLHYKDSNVNVLWVNGLDYLPDPSALDDVAVPPAPSATVKP